MVHTMATEDIDITEEEKRGGVVAVLVSVLSQCLHYHTCIYIVVISV